MMFFDDKKIKIFTYKKNNKEIEYNQEYLLGTLSAAEQNKISRYRYKKDRYTLMVSRFVLRNILSNLLNIENKDLHLKETKYDRPRIDGKNTKTKFDFNVSHSGEWIVWAINPLGSIGIDIEEVREIDFGVMSNVFTQNEIDYVKKGGKKKLKRFYQIWTLKESFVKAIGEGLSYPLKDFYFIFNNKDKITIKTKDKSPDFRFIQYDIDSKYQLSLCIEKNHEPEKVILIKNLF